MDTLLTRTDMVIIPVRAVEQHGPQLPQLPLAALSRRFL
jgi:creatinine amidohydrolase/Fe(II)-dependent formamide hydrolase-like protein